MTRRRSPIRISANGHYFENEDGSPFFYLADTVWLLFGKLKEEEIRDLFADRAKKGFTAIQAVVFRDLFEPNTPNAYGIRPFRTEEDMYAVRMNPEWIAYVVRMTKIAQEYGLVMALLPTWGDKWNERSNSAGPVIMDADSGRAYCRFLSDALAECPNVIWVLGGDSPIFRQDQADTIRAMAAGLREGGSRERLITFHPSGLGTSEIFHGEDWLDFNVLQTSHYKVNVPGYLHIERLFTRDLVKPCLDAEPNYELSPMFAMLGEWAVERTNLQGDYRTSTFGAYDVRKSYYRTVLAGAAGFTYGCDPIRQVYRQGDRIHVWGGEDFPTWRECLSAPGSAQLALLPRLLKERRYVTRVPAQELFLPARQCNPWPDRLSIGLDFAGQQNTEPASHISIARCSEGSYVIAYVPVRQTLTVDTSGLKAERLRLSVYDPEACETTYSYEIKNSGAHRLIPQRDLDTLIIIDAIH